MICVKNLRNDTSCKIYVCTLLSHSSNSEQQYEGGRQCNSKWMTDQKMQTKKLTFGQPTNLCTKAGHKTLKQHPKLVHYIKVLEQTSTLAIHFFW